MSTPRHRRVYRVSMDFSQRIAPDEAIPESPERSGTPRPQAGTIKHRYQ
jgi:hypothetical protein